MKDVVLCVQNLDRVGSFYTEVLGLRQHRASNGEAHLSAKTDSDVLVRLVEDRNARRRNPFEPGLFHTAFLFPTRQSLAAAVQRLITARYPLQGFADHGVSEAVYLADSEGNGIELYCDRPKSVWERMNGMIAMVTEPLDVSGLIAEAAGENGAAIDPAVTIGHIHLQVSSLEKAERFYHKTLGFSVTQRSYPGALFVAAGAYHHHIGLNIWNSQSRIRAENTTGLLSFGFAVPDAETLESLSAAVGSGYGKPEYQSGRYLRISDEDGITTHISVSSTHPSST